MVYIYATSGVWQRDVNNEWKFIVDKEKRGRLLTLESSTTFEQLKMMVLEDFGMDQMIVSVELSYFPSSIINNLGVPPVIIANDRQVTSFIGYTKKNSSVYLCVSFASIVGNQNKKFDLNKDPSDTSHVDDDDNVKEKHEESDHPPKMNEVLKRKADDNNVQGDYGVDDIVSETKGYHEKKGDFWLADCVKNDQVFKSKDVLKATVEIYAMKYNFDYKVVKSTSRWWSAFCKDPQCRWSLRAECLARSTSYIINKCVAEHTCAPSKKRSFGKTASAKTIGNLIKNKYEGVKEGPKPNEIIEFMRKEHGCEISYSQAWESREYAVAAVRGLPEKSFSKIPKYLHMLKEVNPGTHTHYTTESDGRFKYLFLSFGQSVRGFNKAIQRVIVVDGTFLKSKYKGVLLVATAVDGNSNLYPIAFGVVDSENDNSWEWFFMQLKVVIGDDPGLAFVSDRNSSIVKSLGNVYPRARHGICIHHLLSNVVKSYKVKGVPGLVERASKAYRTVEFVEVFDEICRRSPAVGRYLQSADVRKWARCYFPGFRYDIRTNNPAESINSVLKTPREFPVIPLLDSIRELLTRWFYERRLLSSKHKDPLTIKVEKKIDRRILKAKGFKVFLVNEYSSLVKGDKYDCVVDLARKTCTCGKYDLGKIPCRHAIPAIFSRGMEIHRFTDEQYTTTGWRSLYEESINPIPVPEDEWRVPESVSDLKVVAPETRKSAGRRRKRRYESVEDKIRTTQGSQTAKEYKCSRCGNGGHNRRSCDVAI